MIQTAFDKAHKIAATALGYGGVALVPYTIGKQIYIDIVPQSRFFITQTQGDDVTKCVILADCIVNESKTYCRWTYYDLDGADYVITNRATVDGTPCDLSIRPEWAEIDTEIRVPNAGKLLIGYMRCPADGRRPDNAIGVPITYGCEQLIGEIHTTMEEEAKEYRLKRAFVGVDFSMFDDKDKLPANGLFKTFIGGAKGEMWKEYSPEIRNAAYSARTQELFELLEKAVGTSKGILTAPEAAATATEVRRAQHDTWALVGEVRKQMERALTDLAYAIDILCNYYGIEPQGKYDIAFDWDMSMLEDTAETFSQLSELESRNLILPERLVSWATGMTIEEAKAEVEAAQTAKSSAVETFNAE